MDCIRCGQPATTALAGLPACHPCMPALLVIVEAAMTYLDATRPATVGRSGDRCDTRASVPRYRPNW